MALLSTDLVLVQRGATQFKMTANEFAEFVGAVKDVTVADYATLQALTSAEVSEGHRVFVTDATGDPTVDNSWAVYRISGTSPLTFDKIQENESLDVTATVDLSVGARNATSITIGNTNGADVVLPSVNATEAGLATPAMLNNSHVAATAPNPPTNPIVVDANQQVSMDIAQLDPLP